MKKWKIYGLWIGIAELVGLVSWLLSRQGTKIYAVAALKPPFSPPGWIFGVVWPILYGLMGIGAAMVWMEEDDPLRKRGINLFVAQLIVNFFWSLIFFNLQAYGLAFFWLLVLLALAVWMAYTFYQVRTLAGYLQIPYVLWLLFACYLSAGVWILNG